MALAIFILLMFLLVGLTLRTKRTSDELDTYTGGDTDWDFDGWSFDGGSFDCGDSGGDCDCGGD